MKMSLYKAINRIQHHRDCVAIRAKDAASKAAESKKIGDEANFKYFDELYFLLGHIIIEMDETLRDIQKDYRNGLVEERKKATC